MVYELNRRLPDHQLQPLVVRGVLLLVVVVMMTMMMMMRPW